ncbi:carboxylesterase/lipase family protein [Sphingomonas crocodyli]|uniref:Carboxylic ester hydrolase n=1 Tax=Sphingomonas crocodyli TaxID=1979270 RepID=A0A437MAS7_9SPHN|nr:carboxylesterase family protein [Sphingomonas crocodyli]RVT94751.1 carboxylesterase/lipase family protein [Sphingomonas crocodyli]
MTKWKNGIALTALLGTVANAAAPVVTTDLGQVKGIDVPEGYSYRGIPFAAPPVGEGRWKAPAPAKAWKGVRDASQFGDNCIQPARAKEVGPQSENCLTLSVVTPEVGAKKLPVLVSIHGGAFAFGSGRYLADGGAAAIVKQGIVLVSPNYRVGRMGFFAHPALTAEAKGGATANFWLMDQIAALGWVRRNIDKFGGDPSNVTILGCSAGGSSVNQLLVAPSAKGLFAKASVHSGGGVFNASRSLEVAEKQGVAFADRTGIQGTDAAALAKLRKLTPAQVLAGDPGAPEFGAVVDGTLLPIGTAEAFATGAVTKVPLFSGSTSDEASVFGLMGFDKETLKTRFGVDVDALRPIYEEAEGQKLSDAELLRQVQTDFIFTSAAMGVSGMADKAGLPSWGYHFAYVDQADQGKKPGVPHCGDMPYFFGTPKGTAPADLKVSQTMQGYLVNFIKAGDPNGTGLPAWPRYQTPNAAPLVVDTEIKAVPGFRAKQLEFFLNKGGDEMGHKIPR